jgi:hypothetical protein
MKYTFLSIVLFFATFAFGQRPDRAEIKEKLEAQKIAFITDRLDLSPNEAKAFWPIYDEFQEKEHELRSQTRPPRRIEDLSDEEALSFLKTSLKNEEAIQKVRTEYTERFLEVLSAKKVLQLHRAEMDFRREVIEKIKKRFDERRRQ